MPTYPTSTVPAVLAYLQNAFQVQFSGDDNPQNIYLVVGDPGEQAPPDIVEITGVERTVPHFAMVGDGENLAQYESYQVHVKISSAMRGDTAETISPLVTARAWQLLGYVETAVRLDPSLGSIVLTAWPGRSVGGVPVWSTGDVNGMICEITTTVDVENTY